ncbi:unnamed protein product [Gongylonema pulchrum]|uniref:ANK_REP_REGION domain-containing protein n=1 Tax=Gongylonema pulchrum TaxID=637853 RepID=A0A183EHF9_9BILA|nr:unnamed protein product [Gongylonema pulchrum]
MSSAGHDTTTEKFDELATAPIIQHDGIQPLDDLLYQLQIEMEGRRKGTEWFLANSKALINAGLFVNDAADVIRDGREPFLKIFSLPLSFLLSATGHTATASLLRQFGITSITNILGQ